MWHINSTLFIPNSPTIWQGTKHILLPSSLLLKTHLLYTFFSEKFMYFKSLKRQQTPENIARYIFFGMAWAKRKRVSTRPYVAMLSEREKKAIKNEFKRMLETGKFIAFFTPQRDKFSDCSWACLELETPFYLAPPSLSR